MELGSLIFAILTQRKCHHVAAHTITNHLVPVAGPALAKEIDGVMTEAPVVHALGIQRRARLVESGESLSNGRALDK